MEKTYTSIGDLFTREEIEKAFNVFQEYGVMAVLADDEGKPVSSLNDRLKANVVTPEVMARIDKQTGQANDATYLCYVLQYGFAMTQG
jgi:hypothetical protein